MGMITTIRMSSPISHETRECKNLSTFLCLESDFILPVEKAVSMIFDSEKGRDIDSKGVHQLTSHELSFPRDYADICSFLKTYREVLRCLTSNDSLSVTNMDAILTQSKQMKGYFKELYNLDADFYCKILFFVKNKFQLYLKSCYFNKPIDGPAARLMNFPSIVGNA